MTYLKLTVWCVLFFVVQVVWAQDNEFLKREFWKTSPSVATIEETIKAGNNPAQANANNFDGVVYAILEKAPFESLVYLVSKKGNDVNKLTHDGRTYIFWAAYAGNTQFMEYLLEHGAKTDLTDDKGNTILNFAASSGQKNTKVYDLCLSNGADLKNDLTPNGANALLLIAPYDDDLSLLNYFVNKGLDINSTDFEGNNAFNYVAKTGNIKIMDALLEKGIQGNDQAFHFAAYGTRGKANGLEVYQYLEKVGLNPSTTNADGETPLHILAARSHDTAVLSYFLHKKADVNQADKYGNTPFMNATSRNDIAVVKLLFEELKDIHHKNKKGQTALMLALKGNFPEVVSFLLKHGANISVVDQEGNNLAYYLLESFSKRNLDSFKSKNDLLKLAGFDVSTPQLNGNTWYHTAASIHSLELLAMAYELKIDINAKNSEGNTALHIAAMTSKNDDFLRALVSLGADKKALTDFEESALDLASENELLQQNNISLEFLK